MLLQFFTMKLLYLILLVFGLVSGILAITGVLPFFNPNTIICTSLVIPAALSNPEFDLVLFFENCGR